MNLDTNKDISVILPTYNEVDNIHSMIDDICGQLGNHRYEIIVVDDNSPDGTWKKVEKISKYNSNVRLIRRTAGQNLTSAIREGIHQSHGALISWMDSDLSMPPKLLPELIHQTQHNGFDIAVGSRYVKGGGFVIVSGGMDSIMPAFLSSTMNYFIRAFLSHRFNDYTSGFVVARKEVFKIIKLSGSYGEYFIDFIFRSMKKGYKVVEVPYICQPRLHGKSKTGNNLPDYLRRSTKYFFTVTRLVVLNCIHKL